MEQQFIFTSIPLPTFKDIISECVREEMRSQKKEAPVLEAPEFVNDPTARTILSGNPEKPISRPFFNELRSRGLINDYPVGDGRRVVFKKSELIAYLNQNKRISKPAEDPKIQS